MTSRRCLFFVLLCLAGVGYHALTRSFYEGSIGGDYTYFLPWLLSGYYWFLGNGLDLPWFTPAMCAGVPFFPNPQSMFYSVPQALTFITDPLTAVIVTGWLFALIGFIGMWHLAGLWTRLPIVTGFAAMAFTFNGLFLARMSAGHLTNHVYMLLPLLCYWLLRPSRRFTGILDSIIVGAMLAYFVHAGASVMIVPFGAAMVLVLLIMAKTREVFVRLTIAAVAAIVLALGKLTAIAYFMAQFPRDLYPLPGADSLLNAFYLCVNIRKC